MVDREFGPGEPGQGDPASRRRERTLRREEPQWAGPPPRLEGSIDNGIDEMDGNGKARDGQPQMNGTACPRSWPP